MCQCGCLANDKDDYYDDQNKSDAVVSTVNMTLAELTSESVQPSAVQSLDELQAEDNEGDKRNDVHDGVVQHSLIPYLVPHVIGKAGELFCGL